MKSLRSLLGFKPRKTNFGVLIHDGKNRPKWQPRAIRVDAPPVSNDRDSARSPISDEDIQRATTSRLVADAAESLERERELHLTSSQKKALVELELRAHLLFNPTSACSLGIPLQLNSLMMGPTGCGKTIVVESLAHRLMATFVTCSFSSWIPEGAQEGNPTVRQLVRSACSSPRVVLFVDELDKFFTVRDHQNWSASVLNDLWLVLDRSLSWQGLIDKADFKAALPAGFRSARDIREAFRSRVFIVAAGTWQTAQGPSKAVGFSRGPESNPASPPDRILSRGELPYEVLRRFNNDVLTLTYPDETELSNLLERDQWLCTYARETGTPIDVSSLRKEMNTVGMTALTSLKTRLTLKSLGASR